MQFHYDGYVSSDPRVAAARGTGVERPDALPGLMDVLVVGAGPAGVVAAAQLSQFPGVHTRLIDRRGGRLEVGQADGIQPRSVETFAAFGFADAIVAEGCRVVETVFWQPDPNQRERIVRTSRVLEDPQGVSEYPHITVNQARVLDYFTEFMARSPTRMKTDFGWEFVGLELEPGDEYPVVVRLRGSAGGQLGQTRTVRAKYVVGADGAHSAVRKAIGCEMKGDSSHHAWGVMDVLAETDFPDIRTKCVVQSEASGNLFVIPREGGHLFRLYVDLGDVAEGDERVDKTTAQQVIARAQAIFQPYQMDVRHVAWFSVYKVRHSVCDRFDDVPAAQRAERLPRVFVAGDASHTHSAKAGQGMNVSMQDGFNLGWKLGLVLEGRAQPQLLATYSAERQVVGEDIIRFDRQWARTIARPAEDFADPREVEQAYLRITEFAQGFMTQYQPSMITGAPRHQELARGYPLGKRFRAAPAVRVADVNRVMLGHGHRADGRWRLYAFADAKPAGEASALTHFASGFTTYLAALAARKGLREAEVRAWFEIQAIYQQDAHDVALESVPELFRPRVGRYQVVDRNQVYGVLPEDNLFVHCGIDRGGVLVLVRPDEYVAHILPLRDLDALCAFLDGIF